MTALADAERFLHLHPNPATEIEDPIDLLSRLVDFINQSGPVVAQHQKITKLETRIGELEAQVKQANERTRLVEHRNVQLEEELRGSHLFKRVQELEEELRQSRGLVRSAEHVIVGLQSKLRAAQHPKRR